MENLRKLYDDIIESYKHKERPLFDFSDFKEFTINQITRAVIRQQECIELGINTEEDATLKAIFNEDYQQPNRPKRLTNEEKHLQIAQKIKDININDEQVIQCHSSSYHAEYFYRELSFEEFCSYLYWRTQVRNKKECVTPIPFLWLYLSELCNFIEYETIEETYDMFQYLLSIQKKLYAKEIIREAMSDFFVYYGTMEQVQKHRERNRYFNNVKNSLLFLNGTHPDPFSFIAPSVKNSEVYQEYPETVKKYFMLFFSNMTQILKKEEIDIVSLYLGKYELRKPLEFLIKTVRQELVVEKRFVEDDILLREVKKDSILEADMECLGQDIDPGQCIFQRSYVFAYPFKSFENKIREFLGMQFIEASTKEIYKMLDSERKYPNLQKIVEFYESQNFVDCLNDSLKGCENELKEEKKRNCYIPKERIEYIYCGVKFEDKNCIYSYITNDESIRIGDTVIVPTGPYNYADIATVYSIDRYTEVDAPYPPRKCKRIIKKYDL